MRYLLALLAVCTIGCGDENILHPTYVPQTIYPYPPTPPICAEYYAPRNAWIIVPCAP